MDRTHSRSEPDGDAGPAKCEWNIATEQNVRRTSRDLSAHFLTILRLNQSPHAFFKMLSDREQLILQLIGQAFTDAEIAAQLEIAESTAQAYRRDIMRKLDIHSTPKLTRFCLKNGLISAEFETAV